MNNEEIWRWMFDVWKSIGATSKTGRYLFWKVVELPSLGVLLNEKSS
jgi:hypothetical protein